MTTFGCDPEFTIIGPTGKPVPAHAVGLPGKDAKKTVAGGCQYFRDGYNVEVNVPGTYCRALLLNALRNTLRDSLLKDLPTGHKLIARSAFPISLRSKAMVTAPDDVKHFGCDPAMDAYTGEPKVCRVDATTHGWRYAGGHLHFGDGWGHDNKEGASEAINNPVNHATLIRLFDLFIGVPLSVIYNDPGQWRRRQLYGQAGEYRVQKYTSTTEKQAYDAVRGFYTIPKNTVTPGIEYRVPGAELFNHPSMVCLFMGVGRYIIRHFTAKYKTPDMLAFLAKNEAAIIEAINTGHGAAKLLQSVNHFYTPDTIKMLADIEDVHTFHLGSFGHDAHHGWTEWAQAYRPKFADGKPFAFGKGPLYATIPNPDTVGVAL